MKYAFIILFFLFALANANLPIKKQFSEAPNLLASLKARCLGGPYNRVSCFSVFEADSRIIFVGSASGGVFKTTDGGRKFSAVFDKGGASTIGAVTVSQQNPDLVWVGTGEGTHRNDDGWGDGIYKSVDGGTTWENMGLPNSYSFSKIVINSKDNNIVLAGVLGSAWGPNEERGVYRTTDGGKSLVCK